MRFPHSIQAFMCFQSIFGLRTLDIYLYYLGSSHAGFSIYKHSFLKRFDPKSRFSFFLGGRFFLNFVRREKSCFSVTLPRFSGDLTCLNRSKFQRKQVLDFFMPPTSKKLGGGGGGGGILLLGCSSVRLFVTLFDA